MYLYSILINKVIITNTLLNKYIHFDNAFLKLILHPMLQKKKM